MLVLLDATILTNFARVELTSVPIDLWGDQVYTTVEVLREYEVGIRTAGLPTLVWKQVTALRLTDHEQAIAAKMSRKLGQGESTCLAIALIRGAIVATDDKLARRTAANHGIRCIGTVGILRSCIQQGLLSQSKAQIKLEEMIAAGYYSPILNLEGG